MKFKEKYKTGKEFEELFKFRDEKEELDHEAHMIMFRFLSEIEKHQVTGRKLKKNELASRLGVSPSYITQLYNGDKLLNFTMLAKIQKAFDIIFEIRVRRNNSSVNENIKNKIRAGNYANQV
jgi:plasmid maintenance system antidote protein VapI